MAAVRASVVNPNSPAHAWSEGLNIHCAAPAPFLTLRKSSAAP